MAHHPTKRQAAERAILIWQAANSRPVSRYDVAVLLGKRDTPKSLEVIRRLLIQMAERGQLNALQRPGSSPQRFVAVLGMCPQLPAVRVVDCTDRAKREAALKDIAAARVRFQPYPAWLCAVAPVGVAEATV